MVIWITGLSGAGKTSLCDALRDRLKAFLPELVLLDGDAVRGLFGNNLGFSEAERKLQIGRIQSLAKMLSDQGLVVLVGALYAHPDLLAWNRENFASYFEIHLDAPLELVTRRDGKGLYAGAADGTTKDVVGIDIPYHAPEAPDLRIDATADGGIEDMAARVIRAVPRLASIVKDNGA
ncbi:MAG: adenylyl-sulfate kinase [Alphaproteobacteria bacterium]